MRELENQTGVNRETIRVYLRLGLIPEPERPGPKIAIYNDNHILAIAAVKRLQRESRLTLPEIQAIMGGAPTPASVEATAFDHLERLVATRVGLDERVVTLRSLADQAPHAADDAKVLERLGILVSVGSENGEALTRLGGWSIFNRERNRAIRARCD